MKYSVNGNHLNTHIVNMCCCNAINRVLITPFFSMSLAHFVSSIHSFQLTISLFRSLYCCCLPFRYAGFQTAFECNEEKRDVHVCVCVMLHNIGRNRAQTSNRQLFDTTIEFAKSQKTDSIAVSRSCSHPIQFFFDVRMFVAAALKLEIFMWIC